MKLPVSWLRQFVAVPEDPAAVAGKLGACGFAVESIEGEVIDVEVTANRPDCMSVYGLAREAATAFDLPLAPIPSDVTLPDGAAEVKVSIDDAACGRYALALADVTVGPSPEWLAARLTAAGVRPINAVVDVTNYVMLEIGQPMHAFDLAKLAGPEIHVRRARAGEQIRTLDGETRRLDQTMLVIADRDDAIAVAGVMGGAGSEVSASTVRVALESAWFLPGPVRATSRALGLKTEASARFERGADPDAPMAALRRALALLVEIGAGRPASGVTDVRAVSPAARTVRLRRARIDRMLDDAVSNADVERILGRLGFAVSASDDGWQAVVPSFRVDVSREADLIEEVGRHWGFDRITARFPPLRTMPRPSTPAVARDRTVRRLLCGAGLQEAVTFTFIEAAAAAPFAPAERLVTIANPLSEKFAVLRPSLAPGLLESLAYNRNRQAETVRLFEVGTTFSRDGGERHMAGWVLTGPLDAHWSHPARTAAFTDAKGIAELLTSAFGVSIELGPADEMTWLVAGQRAALLVEGRPLGWVGRLAGTDPAADPVVGGEVDLDRLAEAGARRSSGIRPLPRFPSSVRDISILVDERLPAARLRGTIRSNAPATLVGVEEFDRYQGKGIPNGQVSLSFRLTFQSAERTLLDGEIQQAVDAIVAALARDHQATLRGT